VAIRDDVIISDTGLPAEYREMRRAHDVQVLLA
jgi:hypothetical protein